eukprot:NODE_1499_length_957_cov_230.566079_g1040_i0.p1 GENE.NODE_1499_length_957_cov_230.566079_g1040_i0~~NODE_1499_length_957_cov_230.566079_g1040_i0.p1  ORF type:complete len:281 (-),score=116.85 NODE_1499_length_957_cov_230.566079_g1040_i0:115-927(-)
MGDGVSADLSVVMDGKMYSAHLDNCKPDMAKGEICMQLLFKIFPDCKNLDEVDTLMKKRKAEEEEEPEEGEEPAAKKPAEEGDGEKPAAAPAKRELRGTLFFEISIDEKVIGRIEFVIRPDLVPLAAENFRCLCTGEKGTGKSGKPLFYKGSAFHRIIPGFMCQGGDITDGDGTGGESIYGDVFEDENFHLKHTNRGVLSYANTGPHTNKSQFFITCAPTPSLNSKHVVFGAVVRGFEEVVREIEKCGSPTGKPTKKVIISDCGAVKLSD